MSLLTAVNQLGLELDQEAISALQSLPYDQALELLKATQQEIQAGFLKDPKNYICATVERGYVPSAGTLPSGSIGGQGTGHEAAAQALLRTTGMRKVKAAGLPLSGEALKALLTVPASHASEILEAVAEKHTELPDPSNFVVTTISRGGGCGGGKSSGSLYEAIHGRDKDGYRAGKGCRYGGNSAPIGGASSSRRAPTLLESRSVAPHRQPEAQPVSAAPGRLDLAAGPLLRITGADLRAAGTAKSAPVRHLRQPANAAAAATVAEGAVRLAVNGQYVCYVDSEGTKVQVISAAAGSAVVCIDSHGAKVVDMAVAPRDSHLLVAFNSTGVNLYRLPQPRPAMLLAFDHSPQAVDWHPSNPKVFLTLQEGCVLLWNVQTIACHMAMKPTEEAKSELDRLACKASADQLTEGRLQRMAITSDGSRLVAISDRKIWLWSVRIEETWPAVVKFLGAVALQQAFTSRVVTLRVACDTVVAASEKEVAVVVLTPGPRTWVEHQQMISFSGTISADAFPLSTGSKALAILARSGEEEAQVEALLQGNLESGAEGLRKLSVVCLTQTDGPSIGVVLDGLHLPLPVPCQQQDTPPTAKEALRAELVMSNTLLQLAVAGYSGRAVGSGA
ncbi:unnamed protein product [Symbiodinium sp. CCMP2592]|nr:unnamed protein product [Symbiodinium sp. CCMP2592]